jgi:UDP-GlcNAc:undecaprenyl-phosphate GlcNAc-1-phosphate transferase
MLSRSLKGVMPFRPGRDHLHHRLLDHGIKPKRILLIFILSSMVLASIGFILEINFPERDYVSFYAFLILSFTYYLTSKKNIGKYV